MKLRADLRSLLENQHTSSLADKVYVNATSITVVNADDFSANDFILIGVLGSETAEKRKISSISSNTIALTTALSFDHSQDVVVTLLDFDQVRFYRSATLTGVATALAAAQDLSADNIYNFYNDTANSTGYGWYRFYNSVTTVYSNYSNAIPYAGWPDNSVKIMMDTFYTQISNRERKLIKDADVYRWLNEAYTIARNRLNLSNREYSVPTPESLSIVSGTAEYTLPDYFSKVRAVTDEDGEEIFEIPYEQVPAYENTSVPPGGSLAVMYYIRGNKIGFTPEPTASATYSLYYQRTAPVLSSYSDYIELPNANHYFLLDYLLYRAAPIIGGNPESHLKAFGVGLDNLVVTSHHQGGDAESWEHSITSIV
ncbi:hypothetical protein M0R04_06050 [Candidatus Dojkabacteria bacterium]|jgi:hypothetical protein|nr:hypothetical protein [Candidatus Dojkabacteria bacterium]